MTVHMTGSPMPSALRVAPANPPGRDRPEKEEATCPVTILPREGLGRFLVTFSGVFSTTRA